MQEKLQKKHVKIGFFFSASVGLFCLSRNFREGLKLAKKFGTSINCFDKYGHKNTWALVTGGSDGIGLEISQQLARQGFNILMIGRDRAKMMEKLS